MASPGNQHCASCIGTLSFPMHFSTKLNRLTTMKVTQSKVFQLL